MSKLPTIVSGIFPEQFHDRLFMVGGTVRDYILGQSPEDHDLVAAIPVEVLKSCGFILINGKTTVPVWFRHDTALGKIEIIRIDDVSMLERNLLGRDFTINAIAMDVAGRLIDPLKGVEDVKCRIIRPCSDSCFDDDPLRIFRAFRFEASGFELNTSTEALINRKCWADDLLAFPVERFSREFVKALAGEYPGRFFERMLKHRVGMNWLPELFRMPELPAGPLQHHPEGDLLTHSLQVMGRAALLTTDSLARFCAIFHDIGKLSTDPALYPRHHGHEEAGYNLSLNLCRRLCLPSAWSAALAWTSRLHTNLNRWDQLRDSTALRTACKAINSGIKDILPIVSVADKQGNSVPQHWKRAIEVASMNSELLGIDREQLESIPEKKRADFIFNKRIEYYRSMA